MPTRGSSQSEAEDCTMIIHHLTRIQGQIETLKKYVESDRSCEKVAHLMHSILTSFDTARASILAEMIRDEFPVTRQPQKSRRLQKIVSMYKS